MRRISPGLWSFWAPPPEDGIDRAGYYLFEGPDAVVIDPPALPDEDLSAWSHLTPPRTVILTAAHRAEAARLFTQRFGARVLVPRDAVAEDPNLERYDTATALPLGLRPVVIPHGVDAGEVALFWPQPAVMFGGPAFVAMPAGRVRPHARLTVEQHKANVVALCELRFEKFLPAYGLPIESGAQMALRRLAS